MIDHASGIQSIGSAAHNLECIVFPVVNVAIYVQMPFPVSVPLADRKMTQADLMLPVCNMAHFFNGFKITDSSRAV